MVLKRKIEESIRISPSELKRMSNSGDNNTQIDSDLGNTPKDISETDQKIDGYSDWGSDEFGLDGHVVKN